MAFDRGRVAGRLMPSTRPLGTFEPLITAEEAYPTLEKLAWQAERSIWMAYRLFEPGTGVRSPDIPCETWLDLLREKLRQGIEVRIALADFDPIVRARAAREGLEVDRGAGVGRA